MTARAVASLYGHLVRVEVISEQTMRAASSPLFQGINALGWSIAYGMGFFLQTEAKPFGPVDVAFGNGGFGGSVAGAWPEYGIGFSYVMNELRDEMQVEESRGHRLLKALHEAIKRT